SPGECHRTDEQCRGRNSTLADWHQKKREDAILLTVGGSGLMLKPESFDRFFQPFHSTKARGMSIGVSISRSIVEAHADGWGQAEMRRTGRRCTSILPA